ncbi:MAG: DUF1648 domain-containing protein [Thermoflexales bacterium]|nr:DUF1648 domain-containing protein [Thermoflexales bacterium]
MEWKTERQLGIRVTVGIVAWLVIFDLLLIWIVVQLPVTFLTFVIGLVVLLSLPIFAFLVYYLLGLRGSSYALDRNVLTINWGMTQHTIPMAAIERLVPGTEIASKFRFLGGYWPGLWVGRGQVAGLGLAHFYATTVVWNELLFALTPGRAFVISPAERTRFVEAFAQRKAMGPTQEVKYAYRHPELFDWPLWRDKLGLSLVGSAALALLLLFGFLAWRFPDLPGTLPLHYDLAGQADRMGERVLIFNLPVIGLLALVANSGLGGVLYRRKEQFAAYLLWTGALLVQVVLWVTVFRMG